VFFPRPILSSPRQIVRLFDLFPAYSLLLFLQAVFCRLDQVSGHRNCSGCKIGHSAHRPIFLCGQRDPAKKHLAFPFRPLWDDCALKRIRSGGNGAWRLPRSPLPPNALRVVSSLELALIFFLIRTHSSRLTMFSDYHSFFVVVSSNPLVFDFFPLIREGMNIRRNSRGFQSFNSSVLYSSSLSTSFLLSSFSPLFFPLFCRIFLILFSAGVTILVRYCFYMVGPLSPFIGAVSFFSIGGRIFPAKHSFAFS